MYVDGDSVNLQGSRNPAPIFLRRIQFNIIVTNDLINVKIVQQIRRARRRDSPLVASRADQASTKQRREKPIACFVIWGNSDHANKQASAWSVKLVCTRMARGSRRAKTVQ